MKRLYFFMGILFLISCNSVFAQDLIKGWRALEQGLGDTAENKTDQAYQEFLTAKKIANLHGDEQLINFTTYQIAYLYCLSGKYGLANEELSKLSPKYNYPTLAMDICRLWALGPPDGPWTILSLLFPS